MFRGYRQTLDTLDEMQYNEYRKIQWKHLKKFQIRLGCYENLSNISWEIFPNVYRCSTWISDAFVNSGCITERAL